ncbi:MAG: peptidase M14 [Ignavibacteriae bacterium]|nr:peptidase M14 [Ignavibacteriota bacterium]
MKIFIILIIILTSIDFNMAQTNFSQTIYENYNNYKSSEFEKKNFTHSNLKSAIEKIKLNKKIKVEIAGKSVEGKEIYLLSIGKGKTNVLLWSQMHGDESTATMALFDIFNFFSSNDELKNFRKEILDSLKIYFIPMLNPDGAEKYQRRNALDIDLNRDALRLQFPESQILKSVRDSLNPKFAFNLHDQSTRYTSGKSYKSATISFLAPAYNYEKEINEVRANTMKVIVNMFDELNKIIPGHIAKYSDDFEPRAFGDNFVKWGTGSILIESGGWKNDTEKQFVRKLNFAAILNGLYSIAKKTYKNADLEKYNSIPFNDKLLFDVLLKNLTINKNGKNYLVDVGINREEIFPKNSNSYFKSNVEDWGDLSIFYGYEEFDLSGCEIKESQIYTEIDSDLTKLNFDELVKNGIGFIKIKNIEEKFDFSKIPLNILINENNIDLEPGYQKSANFTIWKNGKLIFNVINGFIYNLESGIKNYGNGIIFD